MTSWRTLLLLPAIAAAIGWLFPWPTSHMPAPPASAITLPKVFLISPTTRTHNSKGQLAHIISATRIEQFETEDKQAYSLLQAPKITLFPANNATTWYIHAQMGKTDHQHQVMELSDNVVMTQKNSLGQVLTTLKTQALSINFQPQSAYTDQKVKIITAGNTTTAQGLRISIAQEVIELLQHVRSRYDTHL